MNSDIKISWEDIFNDFKRHFPKQSKFVSNWSAHSYATILVRLTDGMTLLYNYDTRSAVVLRV